MLATWCFALQLILLAGVADAEEAGRSRIAHTQPPIASAVSLLLWRTQLERVRRLRTRDMHENSKIIRNRINQQQEASFSRLFTHVCERFEPALLALLEPESIPA